MILHLIAFTIPILAAYGLTFVLEARDRDREFSVMRFKKTLTTVLAVLGAALFLVLIFKSSLQDMLSGSFFLKQGEAEQYRQQYGQQARQALAHVSQVRFDIFWNDTLKFLIVSIVTVGSTLAFFNRKLRTTTFVGLLVATLLVDLYLVDTKLIDPQPKTDLEQSFQPDATVLFLKDQPGRFRVFPVGRLFGDNTYAYHGIHSIGGYSAAKLKIFQTMIDSCLYKGSDPSFPVNMNMLNMLGVRFVVVPGEIPSNRFEIAHTDPSKGIITYRNPDALPRAFFVDEALTARGDAEVFAIMNSRAFDPSTTAVLQDPLPAEVFPQDTTATVRILDYQSRTITIESNASDPALLVLSEVFYPAGWKAFVDDIETPILRTNSVLRSIVVPAGKHSVLFSFDPPMYELGWQLTHAAWGISALLIVVPLTVRAIRKKRPTAREEEKKGAEPHG
jgi:hypothetical protein